MNTPARPFPWLAATAILTLSSDSAPAATPRSERVASRVAERAYARPSIAEARAVRRRSALMTANGISIATSSIVASSALPLARSLTCTW